MNQFKHRRPKNDDQGSNGLRNLSILTIALVAAIVVFHKKAVPALAERVASLEAKKTPDIVGKKVEAQAQSDSSEESLNQRRLDWIGQSKAGISTLPLNSTGGEISVPIKFLPKTVWCQGGDLDTVRYAMQDPTAKKITVSLESMDGDFRATSINVSAQELMKGFTHNFKIKTRSSGESLGLFICKNSDKAKSCQIKQLKTHNEISKVLADEQTAAAAKKDDYLFYFQGLVVNKSGVSVFKANDYLQKDTAPLQKQLKAQLSVKDSEFKRVWEFASKLKSLPAQVEGKTIVLSMLYNDPRCNDITTH